MKRWGELNPWCQHYWGGILTLAVISLCHVTCEELQSPLSEAPSNLTSDSGTQPSNNGNPGEFEDLGKKIKGL